MFGIEGQVARAATRYDRLFREARRRLESDIGEIKTRNAALGLLKSGGTLRQFVRALDEETVVAVTEALNGIATVTPRDGNKRSRYLLRLNQRLANHHAEAYKMLSDEIAKIGLAGDFKHAEPLMREAHKRHEEKIVDFGEGWTAPTGKDWKDSHPILFALLIAFVSAVLGAAAKTTLDQYFSKPGAQAAPVAPDVARTQKQVPSPVRNLS
jgi:hypothetical protein